MVTANERQTETERQKEREMCSTEPLSSEQRLYRILSSESFGQNT